MKILPRVYVAQEYQRFRAGIKSGTLSAAYKNIVMEAKHTEMINTWLSSESLCPRHLPLKDSWRCHIFNCTILKTVFAQKFQGTLSPSSYSVLFPLLWSSISLFCHSICSSVCSFVFLNSIHLSPRKICSAGLSNFSPLSKRRYLVLSKV